MIPAQKKFHRSGRIGGECVRCIKRCDSKCSRSRMPLMTGTLSSNLLLRCVLNRYMGDKI